jgi:hypothetical protein
MGDISEPTLDYLTLSAKMSFSQRALRTGKTYHPNFQGAPILFVLQKRDFIDRELQEAA